MGGLIRSFFIICCFLPVISLACAVVDDDGEAVRLPQPAQRIIALSPDITESLFAIGAGSQVIGVIHGSDYPAEAAHLPQVGSYTGIDIEKIMSLHPDLIISWGPAFSRQLAALRQLNIPVYTTNPHKLSDVAHTLMQFGCLTGHEQVAKLAADRYLQRLAGLRLYDANRKPVKVFYQLDAYSLMTVNHTSWISEAIEWCGGKNIFANVGVPAPEVSWEAVIDARPDVIVSGAGSMDWKARWQRWQEVPAVRKGYLFTANPDLLERPGPRLVEGVAQICQYLHSAAR